MRTKSVIRSLCRTYLILFVPLKICAGSILSVQELFFGPGVLEQCVNVSNSDNMAGRTVDVISFCSLDDVFIVTSSTVFIEIVRGESKWWQP